MMLLSAWDKNNPQNVWQRETLNIEGLVTPGIRACAGSLCTFAELRLDEWRNKSHASRFPALVSQG
jgi:hypothetical protein